MSDAGRFELICPDLETGAWITVVFNYVVGKEGLRQGAVIRIGLPGPAWSEPRVPLQRYWPERSGKDRELTPFRRANTIVEVATRTQATAYLRSFLAMPSPEFVVGHPNISGEKTDWRYWIDAVIEDDDLAEGDEIRVTYGKKRPGEPGVCVQVTPETSVPFLVYLDAQGDGNFVEIAESPIRRRIYPGRAAEVRAVVPSIVRPGEQFGLRVSITDACGNRPREHFVGSLRATVPATQWARELRFEDNTPLHAEAPGLTIKEEDSHIRVMVEGDLPAVRSNPALCSRSCERVFWGDLHVHTMYHWYNEAEKRGIWMDETPDDAYRYAQEVSFLDFAAVVDQEMSREGWIQAQEAVDKHYQPGRFVAFRGFEAGGNEMGGHRHVIFATGGVAPKYPKDFDYSFPALHEHFRGRSDVLVIPHHPKIFMNWDIHDPELERVVEVYSGQGLSEQPGDDLWQSKMDTPGASVQEALARGYRVGLIGSGDVFPWPGRSVPGANEKDIIAPYRGGLVAVFASELTREEIFEGLRARRCYATTGARMIVRFQVNQAVMGQEIRLDKPEHPRTIRAQVLGTDIITNAEIVRNAQVLARVQPNAESLDWTEEDKTICGPGDYYYLRVFQKDGHRAWSSPIWIDLDK